MIVSLLFAASSYMVIVTGDADRAKAEAAFATFKTKKQVLALKPELLESAKVSGLKPGFFIVAAAVCGDKNAANAVRNVLNLCMPGSYVRPVEGVAESCPLDPKKKSKKLEKRFTEDNSYPVDKQSPGLTWHTYFADSGHKNCESRSVLLRVEQSGYLLAEDVSNAYCREGTGEADLGKQVGYDNEVEGTDTTELFITERVWQYDTPAATRSRVRFSCQGIYTSGGEAVQPTQ